MFSQFMQEENQGLRVKRILGLSDTMVRGLKLPDSIIRHSRPEIASQRAEAVQIMKQIGSRRKLLVAQGVPRKTFPAFIVCSIFSSRMGFRLQKFRQRRRKSKTISKHTKICHMFSHLI